MSDGEEPDNSLAAGRDAAIAALQSAAMMLPHLGGLIRIVEAAGTRRIETAAVFASGRIIVNPDWFLKLSLPDRIFVMAHEVLHLALKTHERAEGSDGRLFNIAHDYIINDMLREELGCAVPADGLDMPGASKRSAEEIVAELKRQVVKGHGMPTGAWSGILGDAGGGLGSLGQALADTARDRIENDLKAGRTRRRRKNSKPRSLSDLVSDVAREQADELERARQHAIGEMLDALSEELELELFPGESARDVEQRRAEVRAAIERTIALGVIRAKIAGGSGMKIPDASAPVDGTIFTADRLRAHPPWEQSLQRWMEDVAPGDRTFTRASRRQGDRTDLVMPGRRREGVTFNLVLDTSGSMWTEIARLLGVIKGFCEAMGIGRLRILQCGEVLEADEIVDVDDLDSYRILGGHGGDLGPGFDRLCRDPDVDAAIVVTDGMIVYPRTPMPFDVL